MENSMKVPQEIKNRISHDLRIPLLGIYVKKTKYLEIYMHLHVYCSIIIVINILAIVANI